ncbi:MAG: two-component system, sensor histidine kinase and response regulator [Desulfovibrionales bacterium]|jgi:DNA-binding response OmpR family regulator|nr:two-component system, sensor histidine kinase and response regulator [Desulfovibrionales bacterium]
MKSNAIAGAAILIVDDSPENLAVLHGHLDRQARVMIAQSGEDALELLKYAAPDIILMDILMPGLDGFETCAKIKQNPRFYDTPVIFVSALSEVVDKLRGFDVGGVDYITKPFNLKEVAARVATHLKLLRTQRELTQSNRQLRYEIFQCRATEDELRENQGRLEVAHRQFVSVLEGMEAGVCVVDPETQEELFANHYFKAIFRRGADGLLMDFGAASDDDDEILAEEWRDEISGRWFLKHERSLLWVDRRRVLLQLHLDITPQKRRALMREDAERITRHDLKSPLNAVISIPQLLLMDDNLTPEQVEMLGFIQQVGVKMLNMISMSLELYRIECGDYEYKPQIIDMAKVVRSVMLSLESMSKSARVSVVLDVRDGCGALIERCLAPGEELLCYSVISNLLMNAIEASPRGGQVLISLKRGQELVLSVSNKGETPYAIRDHFFEKYVTYGKKKGTGLGTYSAKMLTEAMDGSIELDCGEPGATTVRIRMPLYACISPKA